MSNALPRISLVIPNYNSGPVIERCLKSVFDQNYANLELVLAEGESTDESIEICRRWRDRFSVFVPEPDSGIAEALTPDMYIRPWATPKRCSPTLWNSSSKFDSLFATGRI